MTITEAHVRAAVWDALNVEYTAKDILGWVEDAIYEYAVEEEEAD